MNSKIRAFMAVMPAIDISTLKQGGLYVAAMGFSKITQLLAIFVYSYYISPADFGFYSVFISYIWMLAILVSANSYIAIGRYLYEQDVDNDTMLSTVIIFMLFISLLYIFGLLCYLYGFPSEWSFIVWACLLVVSLGLIFENVITQMAAYLEDGLYLLIPSAAKAIASCIVTFTILYVADRPDGMALVLGDVAGAVVAILYFFVFGKFKFRWVVSKSYLRKMFAYALPLTPYMLSLTLLSQFDRVIIDALEGEAAAGFYGLSYSFGILPLIAATALTNALNRRFFERLRAGDTAALVAQSRYIFGVAGVCFAGAMAFGESAAWLLLPARYAPAFDIIPVVAYGGMVFSLFQVWVRVLAFRDKPGQISAIAIAGAVLNIGLNLALIPFFGFKVAAWSTVAAYLGMTLVCMWQVKVRHAIDTISLRQTLLSLALGALPLVIAGSFAFAFAAKQVLFATWFLAFAVYILRPVLADGSGEVRLAEGR